MRHFRGPYVFVRVERDTRSVTTLANLLTNAALVARARLGGPIVAVDLDPHAAGPELELVIALPAGVDLATIRRLTERTFARTVLAIRSSAGDLEPLRTQGENIAYD